MNLNFHALSFGLNNTRTYATRKNEEKFEPAICIIRADKGKRRSYDDDNEDDEQYLSALK